MPIIIGVSGSLVNENRNILLHIPRRDGAAPGFFVHLALCQAKAPSILPDGVDPLLQRDDAGAGNLPDAVGAQQIQQRFTALMLPGVL